MCLLLCMLSTVSSPPTDQLALAAIVHAERGQADPIIAHMIAHLREGGFKVLGIMQEPINASPGACNPDMILIDLATEARYNITQNLGKCSVGCSLDATVVAEASVVLRRALLDKPDLIVVNRFGKLEMKGTGFYDEMVAIIAAGIPLITAVSVDHYAAWEAFTDGAAVRLPLDQMQVNQWCREQVGMR
jgi:nucleoside-triphosphatase THEP1